MEKRTSLMHKKVELYCDECGSLMSYTGSIVSHPVKYEHICTNKECGETELILNRPYPYIETEVVDVDVVRRYCSICGSEIRYANIFTNIPNLLYTHECTNESCGYSEQVPDVRYPHNVYRNEEDINDIRYGGI
jgi:hypothetical protein